MLVGIHAMLSAVTKVPEFVLDKQEGELLASASVDLMAQYDVQASAKAVAWSNFLGVVGMVYGTRLIAARARKATAPKTQPGNGAANPGGSATVINIPGVGQVPMQ